jgi:peptide/nickel transport system substrate-binding protein
LADIEAGGKSKTLPTLSSFVERIMINFTDPNKETGDGERSSTQFSHPFLSDKLVRQAMILAIDRQAIADAYGLTGPLTMNILIEPPTVNSKNNAYVHDPEKAKALLDQAGWKIGPDGIRTKDGVKLHVSFLTSIQVLRQFAQNQVKKDLQAVGFEVELQQVDSGVFLGPIKDTTQTRRQFYADLEEFAFSNKSPDPEAYMAGWTCDQIAQKKNDWSLANWSRYCNPAYDALFKKASTEFDPAKRADLFVQLNDLLVQDAAVIPLVKVLFPNGVINGLKGYDFNPWEVEIWNIADWYK